MPSKTLKDFAPEKKEEIAVKIEKQGLAVWFRASNWMLADDGVVMFNPKVAVQDKDGRIVARSQQFGAYKIWQHQVKQVIRMSR